MRTLVISGIILMLCACTLAGLAQQTDATVYVDHSVHIDVDAVYAAWANPVFVGYISHGGYVPAPDYDDDWFIHTRVSVSSQGAITGIYSDYDNTDYPYGPTPTRVYATISSNHRRVTWTWRQYSHSTWYWIWETRYYDYLQIQIDAYSIPNDAAFSVSASTWTQVG